MLYIATRKGLFTIEGDRLGRRHFIGDPVSAVLAHQGSLYAALNLGHFGVKLRRSEDRGETWREIAAPAYPPQPQGSDDKLGVDWDAAFVLHRGHEPGGVGILRMHGEREAELRRRDRRQLFPVRGAVRGAKHAVMVLRVEDLRICRALHQTMHVLDILLAAALRREVLRIHSLRGEMPVLAAVV